MELPKEKLILSLLKGLSVYIGLVLLWGTLYFSFNAIKFSSGIEQPNLWECIYFSCISFGTIGYGEIIPNGIFGQSLVFFQSITSILFVAVFGGYITYLFIKRPDNIILPQNIHLRPLTKDILFSVRIGNKGQPLVDCKLEVSIMQIDNNIKKRIKKHDFESALFECSWLPSITLNNPENDSFLNCFKIFYNNPDISLIRITMRGIDISTGSVVAFYKYYKTKDVKISGDYLPLYSWEGLERTNFIWTNNNKAQSASQADIDRVNNFLRQV